MQRLHYVLSSHCGAGDFVQRGQLPGKRMRMRAFAHVRTYPAADTNSEFPSSLCACVALNLWRQLGSRLPFLRNAAPPLALGRCQDTPSVATLPLVAILRSGGGPKRLHRRCRHSLGVSLPGSSPQDVGHRRSPSDGQKLAYPERHPEQKHLSDGYVLLPSWEFRGEASPPPCRGTRPRALRNLGSRGQVRESSSCMCALARPPRGPDAAPHSPRAAASAPPARVLTPRLCSRWPCGPCSAPP